MGSPVRRSIVSAPARLRVRGQLDVRTRCSRSAEPRSERFGAVNSNLRSDGWVGEVRFFLTWQEARDAVGSVR
jgi:hypothetical protein